MSIKYSPAVLFLLLLAISASAQSQMLGVRKTFHIRSSGRWDYIAVSPVSDRIYVSHTTQVNILDKNTGDSVGVIEGTIGVHGIVFAPAYNKGFISNGRLNNVFVFDAKTNRITDSIATGTNPDAMCYDSYSKRLIVGNGRSKDLTIIDVATNKVIATVPLGGGPETGVSDGKGRVYIDIEDKNEIAVLDVKSLKIIAHYPLAGGEEPAGLAIDRSTGMLFAGCGNKKLVIVEAATGKQKAILPIGAHCDGVVFDPGTGNVYAANGDGTLTVIHAKGKTNSYSVIATVPTKPGARTIAVDEKTHQVYLPTAEFEAQTNPKERPAMKPGSFQVLVVGAQ